jgi:hypothetical protein
MSVIICLSCCCGRNAWMFGVYSSYYFTFVAERPDDCHICMRMPEYCVYANWWWIRNRFFLNEVSSGVQLQRLTRLHCYVFRPSGFEDHTRTVACWESIFDAIASILGGRNTIRTCLFRRHSWFEAIINGWEFLRSLLPLIRICWIDYGVTLCVVSMIVKEQTLPTLILGLCYDFQRWAFLSIFYI